MKKVTQLTVTLPNIPSSLAKISDALRAAHVNITGMFCNEGVDTTKVHLIVDDVDTAKMVLASYSQITATEVFEMELKNQPGAIASIARKCAGANINIRYVSAASHGKTAIVYLATDNMEKTAKVLK